MQLVNGAQFLIISLFLLFAAAVFGTVIVTLSSIYASLQSHKLDLSIEDLN